MSLIYMGSRKRQCLLSKLSKAKKKENYIDDSHD